jgi:hypothetical protein
MVSQKKLASLTQNAAVIAENFNHKGNLHFVHRKLVPIAENSDHRGDNIPTYVNHNILLSSCIWFFLQSFYETG